MKSLKVISELDSGCPDDDSASSNSEGRFEVMLPCLEKRGLANEDLCVANCPQNELEQLAEQLFPRQLSASDVMLASNSPAAAFPVVAGLYLVVGAAYLAVGHLVSCYSPLCTGSKIDVEEYLQHRLPEDASLEEIQLVRLKLGLAV